MPVPRKREEEREKVSARTMTESSDCRIDAPAEAISSLQDDRNAVAMPKKRMYAEKKSLFKTVVEIIKGDF